MTRPDELVQLEKDMHDISTTGWPEIPEAVWEAARSLRNAVNWQSNESVEIIAHALMKARAEQREEDARIAEADSASYDFEAALAECHDLTAGYHSGRIGVAAAIRNGGK